MKKILMIILDGFGYREEEKGNAIKMANMEYFKSLWEEYPHSLLEASGEAVGLPEGQFGNSEVCHQVIGLGRKIKQRIAIINEEIDTGKINDNNAFNEMINHINMYDSTLHLMGLTSDGGVHSHINYMFKFIKILKEKNIKRVVFHAITDGRDTYQKASKKYLDSVDSLLKEENIGYIGTICGRYYAMDRDNKWDRTYKYYDMIVNGNGYKVNDYAKAIDLCYKKDITDEFLPPLIVHDDFTIKENDCLLWLNFRTDRSRQILNALSDPEFVDFRTKKVDNFKVFNMFAQENVPYAKNLFKMSEEELYPIGKYFSELKLTQARIAETEKYSHVTYFFNSELSNQFEGTDNYLVPSPKVATYDMKPVMSAREVTVKVKEALDKDYDFILVNYANPDMLGHTGNMEATVESLKYLDYFLKDVISCAEENFYKVFILSDHGNCDEMLSDNGEVITTHSLSKVPFIITDKSLKLRENGDLTMVAPTLLKYMDIAIPKDMEGTKNLIIEE